MKRAGSTYRILLLGILWITTVPLKGEAREANIWASVQFNKQHVVVGEPLMITITVYTSTWFTAPPEFGEIQVPEAMMVDYQQRTGAMRKTIGNKTYPAIEKKFVVYPFRVGENSLPALTIKVESPPEGDYKGKRRVILSPERTFTVQAPPDGIHIENWLTSFNVSLSENWDKPLDQLKQGDVLERQLSIRATGALAALIPPLELSHGSFGNVYSKAASLSNVQNETSFTGTRTEHWTYLMEKEGTHSIPGIEVSWYNPVSGKLENVKLEERRITIVENPNLDFLLSMQDSLQAILETGEEALEVKAFEWMGLNWWQLSVLVLAFFVLIYSLIRIVVKLISSAKEKRIRSQESEEWYFEKLMKAKTEGPEAIMPALLSWYDRYRDERFGPELKDFICASGDPELERALLQLEGLVYGKGDSLAWNGKAFTDKLREARKKAARKLTPASIDKLMPLNPGDEELVHCLKKE